VQITYTGNAPANANYAWSFGGGTVISGSGQGPYTVMWTTAGNPQVSLTVSVGSCVSPATNLNIVVSAAPIASFTTTTTLCAGDQNAVNFTGTTGGSANWNWNFGSATVISGSGQGPYQLQYNAAGNYNIDLIVSENGCSDTANIAVLVNPIPSSTFLLPPSVCMGDPVTISYTGSGTSSASCTWGWSGGTVLSGTGQGPYSLVWNTAGNPVVSLTVSENNCTSPQTTQAIAVAPYPAADAGIDALVCSGTSVPVGFSPEAGIQYQWSPSLDLLDPTQSSTSVSTNNSTTSTVVTIYTLTATNSIGCVTTDQVTVIVDPVPVVNFVNPIGQCFEGNQFTFDAGGNLIPGALYTWDFGSNSNPANSNQQTPPAVEYSAPGVYPVTLNAIYHDCPAIPFAGQIEVFISPFASFIPDVFEGCEPLEVPFENFSTGDNNTYHWTYSDASGDDIETPIHIFEEPGTYSVSLSVTTQNGCVDDTALTNIIRVFPVPAASFVPEPEVTTIWEPFIQFENLTVNGSIYAWDFGDSAVSEDFRPTHEYTDTGTYAVILYVVNSYGCMDTVTGIVRVEYGYTFYIPNAFTPNNDGINDFFQGYGTSVSEYEMQIFDRWGKKIFVTNDYFRPWNGRSGNTAVQSDVYVYTIRVKDFKGEVHKYVGRVTVAN
jgi:gliding motility-associated-like protein